MTAYTPLSRLCPLACQPTFGSKKYKNFSGVLPPIFQRATLGAHPPCPLASEARPGQQRLKGFATTERGLLITSAVARL